MELNKKVEVEILQVENPNKFWFRTKSDARNLDEAVNLYVSANSADNSYKPKLDDTILVNINCQWVIAQVESIANNNCIDISIFGERKIRTMSAKDALLLKDQSLIDMACKTIKSGSVSGINPGKKEMNDRLMVPEMKKKLCWTQECIDAFTTILSSAKNIYFMPTNRNIDGYIGELVYLWERSISSMLIDMGYAKPQQSNGNNDLEYASMNGKFNEQDNLKKQFKTTSSDLNEDEFIENSDIAVINSHIFKPTKFAGCRRNNTASSSLEYERQPNLGMNSMGENVMNHALSPITERTELSDSSFSMYTAESFKQISDSPTKQLSECSINVDGSDVTATDLDESKCSENGIGDEQHESKYNFSNFGYKALSEVSAEILSDSDIVSKEKVEILEKQMSPKSLIVDQIEEQTDENVNSNNVFPVLADDFVHSDKVSESSCSSIPSYLLEDSASEIDPSQYEYSFDAFEKRGEEVRRAAMQTVIDKLLENAKLSDKEPITNRSDGLMQFDMHACCKTADEAFARQGKTFPIQQIVWPFIRNKTSTILIGNTEFYPQLLYLPVVCGLIQSMQKRHKIIIVVSNQTQADIICRMSACYLEDRTPSNLVYSNAEEYTNDLKDAALRQCNVFVTLPSWIIKNEEKLPKNVLCFVVNDFEAIPANHRSRIYNIVKHSKAQFIITSNHYVEELKHIMVDVPNVFISMESHYDLFYLKSATHESRKTTVDLIESRFSSIENAVFELRKLLIKMNRKTVVVCRDSETAESIADILKTKFNLNIVLNEKPTKGKKIFICSDDRLMEIGVKAADNIIHYDLPDDFHTFSLRYSVFELSHCNFQTMAPESSLSPSSKIFIFKNTLSDRRLLLLLSLFTRGNTLIIPTKASESKLLELARNLNGNESLCIDIVAHFTNINHMLNCKNRHFLSQLDQQFGCFSWRPKCKVEILDVLSPICFTIRISKYTNKIGIWCSKGTESLKKFSECLNEFYAKSFEPVRNTAELNKTNLYVIRDGTQFFRCQIMDVKTGNVPGDIYVKLVDLGKRRKRNVRDIGYLSEMHTSFPIQPVNLCLLKLVPWNNRCWNEDDTNYLKREYFRTNPHNDTLGNGLFKITIEYELNSNLIFATNLISNQNDDYARHLISKGIASRTTEEFTDFMKRL